MSGNSREAVQAPAGAYPPERAGGARARALEPRLQRIHQLLALERAAYEASRGTQTLLSRVPGPSAGSGLDGPALRFQPSLHAAMAELSGELRLLRREVEQLRRGGIGGPVGGAGLQAAARLPQAPPPILSQVPADVLLGAAMAREGMRRNEARRAGLTLLP